MNYKNFIEEYSKNNDILKQHVFHRYVSLGEKMARANNIIDAAYFIEHTDPDGNTRKVMHIDSVVKNMLTDVSLVDMYTDIERGEGDTVLGEYDLLASEGIIKKIRELIWDQELDEFESVVAMVANDTLYNANEIHSFVREQVERFGSLIGTTLLPVIKEIDTDKIISIIKERAGGEDK